MTNPDGSMPDYNGEDVSGVYGAAGYGIANLFGGAIDTIWQSETARRNTDKTLEAQKAEAEKAYQREVEMWHMNNAYNSPAEQMKRFGAAGLNPHLIYGQGSPGNANSFPKYQAPNLQYRYEAPAFGAASMAGIQQLMQVGTWMQNMKLSEQALEKGSTGVESAAEMLRYLKEANPKKLMELDNRLSTFPYQRDMTRYLSRKAYLSMAEAQEEFRYKFGEDAHENLWFDPRYIGGKERGGTAQLDFLKKVYENKLLEAKSSWTDFNVTDPQSLMEMVMKGAMGMLGQTMRINPKARNAPTIGKGSMGRWSSQAKRWVPTKNWRGQWKSETP